MKKIIAFLLIIFIITINFSQTILANEYSSSMESGEHSEEHLDVDNKIDSDSPFFIDLSTENSKSYFYNLNDDICIIVNIIDDSIISSAYKNDILIQKSILDTKGKTIYTEIYDQDIAGNNKISSLNIDKYTSYGFECTDIHKTKLSQKLNTNEIILENQDSLIYYNDNSSSNDEGTISSSSQSIKQIKNLSVDNSGYTLLQSSNNCPYAPKLTGHLYHKLEIIDEGITKHWKLDAGTSLSQAGAILTLLCEGIPTLPGLIISVVVWAGDNVIDYYQEGYAATYTYIDHYKGVVNDTVMIENWKSTTYWKIHNEYTGVILLEEKSFNGGYTGTYDDLIFYAIGHYYNDIHNPNHTYPDGCTNPCSICGGAAQSSHTYDNSCDPICNVCGKADYSRKHLYNESLWWNNPAADNEYNVCFNCVADSSKIYRSHTKSSYWYDGIAQSCTQGGILITECSTCDYLKSENKPAFGSHTYDNVCDTICNICKATRSVAHSYSNSCDTSCNICGATRSVTHSYSDDCDTTCNICWYTRTTSHTLSGVWVVVGTSSMCKRVEVKCTVCGYNTGQVPTSDSSHNFSGANCIDCGYHCPHTYDNACDTTCNVCQTSRSITHTYDNACDTTCNVCQATRSITHTYDNACDTTCNVCKATRSITHSYSNSCDTTCNICEATRSVTHSYSNDCDTSCNLCWYTRTVTHTLSGVWVVVGTSSMCKRVEVKCSVCGYNTGQVPTSDSSHNFSGTSCVDCGYRCSHTYDNACDTSCNVCQATRSTTHTYSNACDTSCNICQATRSVSHSYSNSCDTICNICEATRSVTHSYSNACDTSCNICWYTRTTTHTLSGVWVVVGTSSMCRRVEVKCSVCGYNTGQVPTSDSTHNYSGGYCLDCGYKK